MSCLSSADFASLCESVLINRLSFLVYCERNVSLVRKNPTRKGCTSAARIRRLGCCDPPRRLGRRYWTALMHQSAGMQISVSRSKYRSGFAARLSARSAILSQPSANRFMVRRVSVSFISLASTRICSARFRQCLGLLMSRGGMKLIPRSKLEAWRPGGSPAGHHH
jgi:hypothetical protein